MINIITQKLKEQFRGVVIYAGATIAYSLMMFSVFPMIQKMDLDALMASYPKEIAKFFSSSGMLDYGKIEGYISMEYLSFFFILILLGYIASTAGSAIAGQIEKRTLDFNLSQPISRTNYVLAETAVALKYSTLIVMLNSLAMFIFGKIYNAEIKPSGLVAFTVVAVVFTWALYGISILLSSLLKSKLSVVLFSFGIALTMYIFGSLTRIIEKLSSYEKFTLFYLYNPENLLKTGTINWNQVGILFLVFFFGLTSAIIVFNRKDV